MADDYRLVDSPGAPLRGQIRVPGSKSITNRAILLAALAEGRSRLTGALDSDDTKCMKQAVATLGADVVEEDGSLFIRGVSGRFPGSGMINAGLGGTPARFLLAAACLAGEEVVIDGEQRLRERPMDDGVALLRGIGAVIEEMGDPGRLPLKVLPQVPVGNHVQVGTTASSQFISALMLIAPALPQGMHIEFIDHVTSASYVRLTAAELVNWGVPVELDESPEGLASIRIPHAALKAMDCNIVPDASSLAYWATAASIIPGSDLLLEGACEDDMQPDAAVLRALVSGGSRIEWTSEGARVSGPATFEGWPLVDAEEMPDGAIAMAVASACGTGESCITGLSTLRIKETDRLEALRVELEKAGARTIVDGDSIRIQPMDTQEDSKVSISTYDDHRMAMAFAVLGLRRGGIVIEDPGCVSKSYPSFWDDLDAVAATSTTGDNAADS